MAATTPTSVTATVVSMTQVDIAWTSVDGEGTSIERSITGTDGWAEVYFCPANDGDGFDAPRAKLYDHQPGGTYYYRIKHLKPEGLVEPSASTYQASTPASVTTTAANNIYYVAPSTSGSDAGAGTSGDPFNTIQFAVNSCVAGDVVRLQQGTHTETLGTSAGSFTGGDYPATSFGYDTMCNMPNSIQGTYASPILIEADPVAAEGTVIMDGQSGALVSDQTNASLAGNQGFLFDKNNFIQMRNFTMTNCRSSCIDCEDNHPTYLDASGNTLDDTDETLAAPNWTNHLVLSGMTFQNLYGNGQGVNVAFLRVLSNRWLTMRSCSFSKAGKVDNEWLVGGTAPTGATGAIITFARWGFLMENCTVDQCASAVYLKESQTGNPTFGYDFVGRYNIFTTNYSILTVKCQAYRGPHASKVYSNVFRDYYQGIGYEMGLKHREVINTNNTYWSTGNTVYSITKAITFGTDCPGIDAYTIAGNIFEHNDSTDESFWGMSTVACVSDKFDENIYAGGFRAFTGGNNYSSGTTYSSLATWQAAAATNDTPLNPGANSTEETLNTVVTAGAASGVADWSLPNDSSPALQFVSDASGNLTNAGPYQYGGETVGLFVSQASTELVSGSTIEANGLTFEIDFATAITDAGTILPAHFTIAGSTVSAAVLTSSTLVTLTISSTAIEQGAAAPLITYTQPGTGLQDGGVDVPTFQTTPVNNSTVDTVAPVLSSPIGIQTGTTTASGTVTTDEGNGTLYWKVTASATPPASGPVATITSKQDLPSEYGETTDPLGVSFSTTTDGSGSGATLTCTARTFDAGMQLYRVDQFTLNAGGTGYQVGDSLVMQLNFPPFGDYPSCTVATTSSNATFISDATSAGDTQTVSATGSQIVSVTGLSAATSYYIHFLHVDAASNESNVSTSAQFTTQALTAPTLEQGVMNPDLPIINSAGSTLTLTFSEAVTTSAATGLTLSTGETLTYSSGSTTDTIVYTISPYAQAGGGGEILNFAGGANVIEATVGGADVEAFSDALVSSQSTATAPVVVGDPTVDETGTLLTVVFSSASLANQTTPVYSPFTLTGTLGGVYTFTNASIPANTGIFTVSPAVEYNDVLSLSFTQAGGTFTDGTTGIELATFTDTVVNNTSATDNEPPIFTAAPDVSKTTVQGHSIRQTINETGVVYGVRIAVNGFSPDPSQVKAGLDGNDAAALEFKSVATTADTPCVLTFSGGAKNTAYDYYIVAEDSVPNLQVDVRKVTATTANLLFNGSGGKGLRPDEGSKKKVKMMWDSKNKRR